MTYVGRVDWRGKPTGPLLAVRDRLASGVDPWLFVEEMVLAMLKKPDKAPGVEGGSVAMVDVKAKQAYPLLWDYLTQSQWEDGSARETAGLTLFVQDGTFKALLKDNEFGLCLWAAAPGFFDVLATLEKLLASPAADWRVDRARPGKAAKKR